MCLGAEMIGAEVSHDSVLPVLCVFVLIFSLLHYDVNVWCEASELPWQLASENIASLDVWCPIRIAVSMAVSVAVSTLYTNVTASDPAKQTSHDGISRSYEYHCVLHCTYGLVLRTFQLISTVSEGQPASEAIFTSVK